MSQIEQVEVKSYELSEVPLSVHEVNGVKCLVMGPLALTLPLNPETLEWLDQQAKHAKIQVVPADAMPPELRP